MRKEWEDAFFQKEDFFRGVIATHTDSWVLIGIGLGFVNVSGIARLAGSLPLYFEGCDGNSTGWLDAEISENAFEEMPSFISEVFDNWAKNGQSLFDL